MKYILPIFFLALSSCASVSTKLAEFLPSSKPAGTYYYNDMLLSVNGTVCHAWGICQAAKADKYVLKIENVEQVSQVVVTTAYRTDSPDISQIGTARRGYVYNYIPNTTEKQAGTILKVSGLMKEKGKVSSGIIVFQHPDFKATAGISCNSTPDYRADGVAICQLMKGQRMKIWFVEDVKIAPSTIRGNDTNGGVEACQIAPKMSKDGREFEFEVQPHECTYMFRTTKAPAKEFMLYTVGADDMLAR